MSMKSHVLSLLSVVVLSTTSAFAAPSVELKATVEIGPQPIVSVSKDAAAVAAPRDLPIRFTLTNTGTEDAYVLKRNTPFYGISRALFEVTRDGETVPYIGRIVHYGHPEADDYFVLKAGESRSQMVELSSIYDTRVTGRYSVVFDSIFQDVLGEEHGTKGAGGNDLLEVRSEAASLWINGVALEDLPAPVESVDTGLEKARTPNFRSCSASRQNDLLTALSGAQSDAANAFRHLKNNPNGSARYDRWFGNYSSTRFNNVKANFKAIRNAARDQTVTFDCGCNERGVYAYVYPNRPYEIWLCNAFWPSSMYGTDGKVETVVHELSHFTVVADTLDVAYGYNTCLNLADSSPRKATRNADNHAYFASNN